ncbi:MAG TPA: DHA2 family efflux MFS transporter permease subunit [Bradyrhizobium sp.]|jgi:EmrB/QacA subfamily drug resistance transporter|uniref:DHA2 family efflux MFS transporter permease subunit n=1 Tax=Bradyrhizobium sp. TaxID=376 RepID=UPI002CE6A165|nr:DHA2 family efflux MFS transporter permease subunit [Bradyrhizobium sp.]HTA99532.1 DHA2 family efflux MFS transporter permease subunit [Bradyrhizobium sp.]
MQELDDRQTRNWTLGITALASFMMALDGQVVTTAFATIRSDFDASVETLQWTVNAYNLSFAVLLLTGAAIGDRFGRRAMFAGGIFVFALASVGCALSGSAASLIAARAVQGAGAALVMPLAMAILSGAFPKEERAQALGIFSGVTGFALIIGPAIGGFITESFGWRWIFWINLPIGLIAIALVFSRLRESFGSSAKLDIPGLAIVAAAALALVWGLLRGNMAGWSSRETVGALATGTLLAVAFVAWELRASAPMVPMRLFRARAFASGVAASFLFYAAMYGMLFLLPQFLQAALGYGPFGAGLRLLPWTATLFLTAPIAGALVNKAGERPLVVAGLLMQAIGLGWIAINAAPGMTYSELVAPLLLAGVGVSMAMPAAQNAILGSVAATEIGKASGVFNMGRFLGGMFGIAAMVAVFSANGAVDSAASFSAGFAASMRVAAGLSLLGAVAGLWLPARRRVTLAQLPRNA